MQNPRNIKTWACKALEVYAERGIFALEALQGEQFEDFEGWMRKRNAAYQNFLVAEDALKKAGVEAGIDPDIRALMTKVQEINGTLSEGISAARDGLQGSLVKTMAARKKLAHFRASSDSGNRFQDSV